MKHFLRKIDVSGLFLEDLFWDDGAYSAVIGVPLMTVGSPAVPAVLYQPSVPAVEAAMGVEAKPAIPEVLAVPAVPEVPPVQQTDAQGNLLWTTASIPAFAGNPIPANMIATPVPGGFHKPKWLGMAWGEGEAAATVAASLTALQAAITKEAQDTAATTDAKSYAKLQALRGMTPAQVQGWVTTNVTTLAQAIDAIKTLAVAVAVLSRKL